MARFVRIETAENYFIEYDREDKCVMVFLTNRALRRRFKTPMLFSYDGKTWIKSGGRRAVTIGKLADTLKMPRETTTKIQALLKA